MTDKPMVGTFITLIAAIGFGSIISALIGHHVAISGHRQAWINALRDDLAEFVRRLDVLAYAIRDWMNDSEADGVEQKRRVARTDLLLVYERIRLRLNQSEASHIELEAKLTAFIDEPLLKNLETRTRINELIALARKILKDEWEVTKYPWKPYIARAKKRLWG
jgi:hypothetical protein